MTLVVHYGTHDRCHLHIYLFIYMYSHLVKILGARLTDSVHYGASCCKKKAKKYNCNKKQIYTLGNFYV